jgi:hypothetical protein
MLFLGPKMTFFKPAPENTVRDSQFPVPSLANADLL